MTKASPTDVIDELIADWNRERPNSRPEAMAIVGRIIRLGKIYQDEISRTLRAHHISYSDFDVLATLRRKGEPYTLTPTALQRSVLLTSGAMTACLLRLEKADLLERMDNDEDGRSRSARLSHKGLALVDTLIDQRFALAADEINSLSAGEVKAAEAILRRLSP